MEWKIWWVSVNWKEKNWVDLLLTSEHDCDRICSSLRQNDEKKNSHVYMLDKSNRLHVCFTSSTHKE